MKKILVLGRSSASTQMLIQCLNNNNYDVEWCEERRDDKKNLLIKRVKKQGIVKVFGQLLFLVFQKYLHFISRQRKKNILDDFGNISDTVAVFNTPNINLLDSVKFIEKVKPDLIVLSGTRILSPEFLAAVHVPILNIHAGINPKYRGVHGGYWALVNKDTFNCGSTIHRVDEGIDTGEVLAYARIKPTTKDNFVTYPILQQKAALDLIPKIVSDIFLGNHNEIKIDMDSKIWTHPTIWQYIFNRLKLGVK
jgi:formyltetrahydrofolate hydrolase